MTNEYQQWLSDIENWRNEVAIWRRNVESAKQSLKGLDEALGEFTGELGAYAHSLERHRIGIAVHGHALAELERCGGDDCLSRVTELHQKFADRHAGQRAAHARIKTLHDEIINHWSVLLRALRQAPGVSSYAQTRS